MGKLLMLRHDRVRDALARRRLRRPRPLEWLLRSLIVAVGSCNDVERMSAALGLAEGLLLTGRRAQSRILVRQLVLVLFVLLLLVLDQLVTHHVLLLRDDAKVSAAALVH